MKAKKILLLSNILFLLLGFVINAQNPNFQWATKVSGSSWGFGNSITTDNSSNVYTTGTKSGNIFIQKQDPIGNIIWTTEMGASDYDGGSDIKIDESGFIYVTGYFRETVDFDPDSETFNLTAFGDGNAFILKLDPNGQLIWVKQFGGSSSASIFSSSIDLDSEGNALITGAFAGIIDFDPGLDTFQLTAPTGDRTNIFISKLDIDGNFVWAKSVGGNKRDSGNAIAVDSLDNVVISGHFNGTLDIVPFNMPLIDFDPGPGIFYLESNGSMEIFVLKLDADGNFIWAKHMGGGFEDSTKDLTLDEAGNIYSTGNFLGTSDFDPGPGVFNLISTLSSGSGGVISTFISKLNTNGDFVWAKQLGKYVRGYGIDVDHNGNVFITGSFNGTKDFNPGPGSANLTSIGTTNCYILKLNNAGGYVWAKQFGGAGGYSYGYSVFVDALNNIYSTGRFNGAIDFDPGPSDFYLGGSNDVFIHKMDQCTISLNLNSTDYEICEGESSTLTATGGLNYLWNTGDTTTFVSVSPSETTSYSVTITDGFQCIDSDSLIITVETVPTAQFDYVDNNGMVDFENLSSSNVLSYEWDFGDNSSSTESVPSHEYAQSGIYTVQLIVFNECGSDTVVQEIIVDILDLPVAAFSLDNGTGCVPLLVEFVDESTGVIESRIWTFPGGTPNTSTEQNPEVIYETPGIFDVTLVVSNASGSHVITYEELIIVDFALNAGFSFSINENVVEFTNTSQNASTFSWIFGDDSPLSFEENPTHIYEQPGVYLVTLVASNDFCGSAISQNIEVLTTSTRAIDGDFLIEIFPNPATHLLHIKSDVNIDRIQIYNILGQQILEINDAENIDNIDLKHLPSGTYVITLLSKEHLWSTEFVKQ